MKEVKTFDEFRVNLLGSGITVLKIGTSCCGPCTVVEGNLENLEKTLGEVNFLKIDAEECDEEFLDSFNVRNIPTLIYFRDGTEATRTVGMQTEAQIKEKIDTL